MASLLDQDYGISSMHELGYVIISLLRSHEPQLLSRNWALSLSLHLRQSYSDIARLSYVPDPWQRGVLQLHFR